MNIITRLHKTISHFTWDIAYTDFCPSLLTEGINWRNVRTVKNPYKNKWFADPFILDNTESQLTLLVEEFDYSFKKGRIARITINKNTNTIDNCNIILELPTHLSFPAIYRRDGKVFVHPENSASGSSYIYEYDVANDRLVNPRLMIDQPITDAIIKQEGDKYKMFATCMPNPNGEILKEFVSNSFIGGYKEIGQTIYPNNTARMAGHYIISDGIDYRPAQCCKDEYGQAVVIYDDKDLITTIVPKLSKYDGLHTFNVYDHVLVMDLKKYDYPRTHRFFTSLKRRHEKK